jgi:hypothetical protein
MGISSRETLITEDGDVVLYHNFFGTERSDRYLAHLLNETPAPLLELVKDQISCLSDQVSVQAEVIKQNACGVTETLYRFNQIDINLRPEISQILEEIGRTQVRIKGLDEKITHSQQALWIIFRDRLAQEENQVIDVIKICCQLTSPITKRYLYFSRSVISRHSD